MKELAIQGIEKRKVMKKVTPCPNMRLQGVCMESETKDIIEISKDISKDK